MSEILVYWGAQWITPEGVEMVDDKTIVALVMTRSRGKQWVRFINRSRGGIQWQKNKGNAVSFHL